MFRLRTAPDEAAKLLDEEPAPAETNNESDEDEVHETSHEPESFDESGEHEFDEEADEDELVEFEEELNDHPEEEDDEEEAQVEFAHEADADLEQVMAVEEPEFDGDHVQDEGGFVGGATEVEHESMEIDQHELDEEREASPDVPDHTVTFELLPEPDAPEILDFPADPVTPAVYKLRDSVEEDDEDDLPSPLPPVSTIDLDRDPTSPSGSDHFVAADTKHLRLALAASVSTPVQSARSREGTPFSTRSRKSNVEDMVRILSSIHISSPEAPAQIKDEPRTPPQEPARERLGTPKTAPSHPNPYGSRAEELVAVGGLPETGMATVLTPVRARAKKREGERDPRSFLDFRLLISRSFTSAWRAELRHTGPSIDTDY